MGKWCNLKRNKETDKCISIIVGSYVRSRNGINVNNEVPAQGDDDASTGVGVVFVYLVPTTTKIYMVTLIFA